MVVNKNFVASILVILTVVVILFLPKLVFNIFTLLFIQMALYEYLKFIKVENILIGMSFGTLISASFFFNSLPHAILAFTFIVILYIGLLVFQQNLSTFRNELNLLVGWLYISWLMSFVILIRFHDNGVYIVFFLFILTAFRNIGAGLIGCKVRGHRISKFSPNKTYEGAFIGFVFTSLVGLIFYLFWPKWISFFDFSVMSILVGILGQVGDLAASMFKRMAGVRNSGNLLGKQGGFLDTIDSFAFTAPTIYIYYFLKPYLFE